ncbi:DUF58 domain-containing protein [Paenibacillus sp. YN15]|uniref:DUF58 domain-containing protein n=1 Tax=Paenibacillus sp. YN15 TaxID=1742774 RepID=UPI000DCCFD00|nr:DUF58 domain-containing protein [Paenibacillus sp. YN15]RAU93580.1 hypothetical protein DQG13_25515 [Paenibacillus sp. YN15]
MWFLLWLGLVMLLVGLWAAPNYWERRVYPRVRLEVRVSRDYADPGEELELRIRVVNPTRLPCPKIRLDFVLPDELALLGSGGERRVRLDTYLLARQSAELIVSAVAVRRGVARWNQAVLECVDLFGLQRSILTVYPQMQVVIRPARLAPGAGRRLLDGLMGEIRVRRFIQEDPSLFTGVRPYASGDPLKSVSWFATARTGGLMVKQFGHTADARVWLLLNGQMSTEQWAVASRDRLDRLCEHVLQLAVQLTGEQAEVGFLTNLSDSLGSSTELPPAAGPVQPERLANRLGSLSRYTSGSQADMLRAAGRAVRPGDTVVLVTDYRDAESSRSLEALRRLGCPVHVADLEQGSGSGEVSRGQNRRGQTGEVEGEQLRGREEALAYGG